MGESEQVSDSGFEGVRVCCKLEVVHRVVADVRDPLLQRLPADLHSTTHILVFGLFVFHRLGLQFSHAGGRFMLGLKFDGSCVSRHVNNVKSSPIS